MHWHTTCLRPQRQRLIITEVFLTTASAIFRNCQTVGWELLYLLRSMTFFFCARRAGFSWCYGAQTGVWDRACVGQVGWSPQHRKVTEEYSSLAHVMSKSGNYWSNVVQNRCICSYTFIHIFCLERIVAPPAKLNELRSNAYGHGFPEPAKKTLNWAPITVGPACLWCLGACQLQTFRDQSINQYISWTGYKQTEKRHSQWYNKTYKAHKEHLQ